MQIRCGTFNLFQFVEPPFAWYERDSSYLADEWLMKKEWIKNKYQT